MVVTYANTAVCDQTTLNRGRLWSAVSVICIELLAVEAKLPIQSGVPRTDRVGTWPTNAVNPARLNELN